MPGRIQVSLGRNECQLASPNALGMIQTVLFNLQGAKLCVAQISYHPVLETLQHP